MAHLNGHSACAVSCGRSSWCTDEQQCVAIAISNISSGRSSGTTPIAGHPIHCGLGGGREAAYELCK
jgi:hypothetical protein